MYVLSISESLVNSVELTITAHRVDSQEKAQSYISSCRQIDNAFGEGRGIYTYEIVDLDAEDLPQYASQVREAYSSAGCDWKAFKDLRRWIEA